MPFWNSVRLDSGSFIHSPFHWLIACSCTQSVVHLISFVQWNSDCNPSCWSSSSLYLSFCPLFWRFVYGVICLAQNEYVFLWVLPNPLLFISVFLWVICKNARSCIFVYALFTFRSSFDRFTATFQSQLNRRFLNCAWTAYSNSISSYCRRNHASDRRVPSPSRVSGDGSSCGREWIHCGKGWESSERFTQSSPTTRTLRNHLVRCHG